MSNVRLSWIIPFLGALALIATAQNRHPTPSRDNQNGGGLKMHLLRTFQPGESPRFALELQNTTNQGMVLEIGTTLGNGRAQYLDAFRYMLQKPDGQLVELTVHQPASICGNLPDPLAVPLAPGAMLTLPINFADMLLEQVGPDWRPHLGPGTYTFWVTYTHLMPATGTAGPAVLPAPEVPYWVGSLQTEPLTFTVP